MKNKLLQYEQDFFCADFCRDASNLESRLSDSLCEYGCSGRVYDKPAMIAALTSICEDRPILISDFEMQTLCTDVLLVHYKSYHEESRETALRTSIWRKEDDGWKLLFHQGTHCEQKG